MADLDRCDEDWVRANAYASARQHGCDDATAQEAARLAVEQAAIRAQQLVESWEWLEQKERRAQPPTLSLRDQFELWSKRGRGWEDPSQDHARIQSMYSAGATPDAVTDAIYPYRRDLIVRGRRSPIDQVEYARMMAEVSHTIESTLAEATTATRGRVQSPDESLALASAQAAEGQPGAPGDLKAGDHELLELYRRPNARPPSELAAAEILGVSVREIARRKKRLSAAGLIAESDRSRRR